MKKILILIALLYFTYNSFSQDVKYKRYTIESGIIEFEVSGLMNCNDKLVFDKWGSKEARFSLCERTQDTLKSTSNRGVYLLGDTIYNVDILNKSGEKKVNFTISDYYAKTTDSVSIFDAFQKAMEKMGGKIVNTDTVLGKECLVWEVKPLNLKFWTWNNIALKTVSNFGGQITTTVAVKIIENQKIPEELFVIPSDYKIQLIKMDE